MNDSSLTLDQQIAAGRLKLVYRLIRCCADNSPDVMVFETHSKTLAWLGWFGLTQYTKMTSTNDQYWYEVHETMLFTPTMV